MIATVLLDVNNGLNGLSFIQFQEIDHWQALGCTAVLRDFIAFETINSAFIGKEEQSIVGTR